MVVGLDDGLRGSAAVPRGELDVADIRRRVGRRRLVRRLLSAAVVIVALGLGLAAMALTLAL